MTVVHAEQTSPVLGLPTSQATGGFSILLRQPVDGSSLAVFRIVFGAVGVLSMVRIVANGWVRSLYAGPEHHFTYPLLGWVRAPSVGGMYVLVAVVGVAAACVAVGWHFRVAMAVFWIGFAWIEFIDVTTYLNHYWFVTLAGALLIVAPATNDLAPGGTHRRIANGWIWLFRFQIGVVYLFAGLAKLNSDWLLHALPLRLWLPTRTDVPVIGRFLAEPSTAYALSWVGALFDCSILALLLWRRTRLWAWFAVVAFHVITWRLFAIGVFPWLMIGVTTIFFDPAWPRDVWARVTRTRVHARAAPAAADDSSGALTFVTAAAVAWAVLQVAMPLRHLAIPGDYRWTGEGYRWSWNVLLTERGGDVSFRVTDPATGRQWIEDASDRYTPLQWKVMSTDAELIRQAAHLIANDHRGDGLQVEVRADAFVSLNGRRATRLIDPSVDLAREPWRPSQPWITESPTIRPP